MSTTVRQHDGFDDPGLAAAWTGLSESVPGASLFTSMDWCRAWSATVGREARPVVLQVLDAESRTLGIAPLCVGGQGTVRWLRFMGREGASGDHLDVLCAPKDVEACLNAVLDHLDSIDDEFDGLVLGELAPTSPTLEAVITWAEDHGFPWREREYRKVPFIDLPDTLDALLAGLSSNMKYHVRRRRRGLAKVFGARTECIRDADRVDEVLTAFFDLHRRRWERDGLPGNFQDEAMQAFLRSFCRAAADNGWLRCHALSVGNEIQCVLIAFHWRQTAYCYQMGWKPECPVESPGVVLMAQSIEQAIGEDLARYDFLRGDEPYKSRWTSWAAEQTTLVVGCRLAARSAVAADRLKDGVKAAVCQCLGEGAWDRAKMLVTGRT